MEVKFKKTSRLARKLTRATSDSASYDLYSLESKTIGPWVREMISTDFIIKFPRECCGRIAPRSGLLMRESMDVGGGVIDADYRGKIKIILINQSDVFYPVKIGERIAQLIFQKIETPNFVEVDQLSVTQRNDKGFGFSRK